MNHDFSLPAYSDFPEFEIYIDQLVTIINTYNESLISIDSSFSLTKSMVNNYVKMKLLPKPVHKRYNRMHLAIIQLILYLKYILQMSQIDVFFQQSDIQNQYQQVYEDFFKAFKDQSETDIYKKFKDCFINKLDFVHLLEKQSLRSDILPKNSKLLLKGASHEI